MVYRLNPAYLTHCSQRGPERANTLHQRVRLTPSRQRTVTARKSRSAIDEHCWKFPRFDPLSKRSWSGLKTLFSDPHKLIFRWNYPVRFPLAASSVGSPPAQLSAALRVLHWRFGPAGVRSSTQPTVVVAKGKIANCRVTTRRSQTPNFCPRHAEHSKFLSPRHAEHSNTDGPKNLFSLARNLPL